MTPEEYEALQKKKGCWYQGRFVPTNKNKLINKEGFVEYKSAWEAKICFLCDRSVQVVR